MPLLKGGIGAQTHTQWELYVKMRPKIVAMLSESQRGPAPARKLPEAGESWTSFLLTVLRSSPSCDTCTLDLQPPEPETIRLYCVSHAATWPWETSTTGLWKPWVFSFSRKELDLATLSWSAGTPAAHQRPGQSIVIMEVACLVMPDAAPEENGSGSVEELKHIVTNSVSCDLWKQT